MEFIKKINFIVGHLDRYDDFCNVPTTHKIHEKTILIAKQMLYNNHKIHSFINIHAYFGFVTMILDFPISIYEHENYINDIKNYIMDLDATGYTVVLFGDGIKINNNKKNISENFKLNKLEQKVEIMTENSKGLKLKSIFVIEDVHYRRIQKKRLMSRINSKQFNGKFSGLMKVLPKKNLI